MSPTRSEQVLSKSITPFKADIHVHSCYSSSETFMLKMVRSAESYTTPKALYDTCKRRGMDLVTITDHDCIAGALEIAHLPDTFVSEEITATFADDGVKCHVVALDIDETQHTEIQRLRCDIYELVEYLRSQHIPHFVAHPLSMVNMPITPRHLQQMILLFKHLEVMNGTHCDRTSSEALQRILSQLAPQDIINWANTLDVEPVDWTTERFLVGGSDDHGQFAIARAHTIFRAPGVNPAGMREAFFAGDVAPAGTWGTAKLLSHNIYSVTFRYFQNHAHQSAYGDFLSLLNGGADQLKDVKHREIIEAVQLTLAESDTDIFDIMENPHTDESQTHIYNLGRAVLNNLLKGFFDTLLSAVSNIDLETAFEMVPKLLSASSLMVPYLYGFRHHVRERNSAEQLAARMGFGHPTYGTPRLAIFTDTGFDVNGVALGLRRLVCTLRELGHAAELVVCATVPEGHVPDTLEEMGGLHNLSPIAELALPVYQEMRMGIPSLVDVMEYLAEHAINVVQLSTPGPLGLLALLAAKLMGLKIVANYHTEIPKYTELLTGDRTLGAISRRWTSWFYRQAELVIVPSVAAKASLVEIEVPVDRIVLVERGVDTRLFTNSKRNPKFYERYGMNGCAKLLYVGRVSKEKGLDTLLSAFEVLRASRIDASLIVVGDGPYLPELVGRTTNPAVRFLGYMKGEDLTAAYASSDVFVFPSDTDTFGNVVLEAQASGLPAIVVDKGGPAEQVTNGINGLVVPAGQADEMATAILSLLRDPEKRARMGQAGRRRAVSMDMLQAASAHWDIYGEVCESQFEMGASSQYRATRPSEFRREVSRHFMSTLARIGSGSIGG